MDDSRLVDRNIYMFRVSGWEKFNILNDLTSCYSFCPNVQCITATGDNSTALFGSITCRKFILKVHKFFFT
jgi:hypothetical protein